MIATLAPRSAAARAARWPARPAPMISTSCEGTARGLSAGRSRPLRRRVYYAPSAPRPRRSAATAGPARSARAAGRRAPLRPAGWAGRSAWRTWASVTTPCSTPSLSTATIAPSWPIPSAPEQRFQGRLGADPHRHVGLEHVRHRQRRAPRGDLRGDPLLADHARGSAAPRPRPRTTASGSAGRTLPGRPAASPGRGSSRARGP